MSDAWGGSWGSSWGVSWGSSSGTTPVTPTPTTTGDRTDGGTGFTRRRHDELPGRRIDYAERDRIAAEFRAAYEEIYGKANPDGEIADRAAALVAEYTPTSAPDFPPAAVIDWQGLADDTARLVSFRDAIRELRRQVEAERLDADDEETLLLLM